MATLKFVNEAGDEEYVHLGPDRPEVVIGRNKDCELRTRNNTVSRMHAKIVWRDGKYLAIDLDSANGTFYKRKRIKEVEIEHGETVFCGSLPVEFQLEDSDRAPPEPVTIEPPPLPPPVPARAPTRSAQVPAAADRSKETVAYDVGDGAVVMVPAPPPAPVEDEEDVVSFGAAEPEAAAPPPARPAPAPRTAVAPRTGVAPKPPAAPPSSRTEGFEGLSDRVAERVAEDRIPAPAPAPVTVEPGEVEVASEIVRFGTSAAPDAKRILQEEKRREAREARVGAREAELEALVAERDATIRKLGLQVEELSRLVQRFEETKAKEAEDEAAPRAADLERVLASAEAERASIEEALEGVKSQLEDAERGLSESRRSQAEAERIAADGERRLEAAERELAAARTDRNEASGVRTALEAEIAGLKARLDDASAAANAAANASAAADREELEAAVAEARSEVDRIRREKDALAAETERWDALKLKFEEERSVVQAEVEGLRRQVSEVTVQLTDARAAASKAEETARTMKAAADELAEVKVANRSYLKKISRLLEENEKLRAGAGAGDAAAAEIAGLKSENAGIRAELEKAKAEAAEAAGRAERMAEKVAALEAAPPPAAPAPAPAAPSGDPGVVREALDRINELASESRTSLEVVTGLLPDLLARLPEGPDKVELSEQVQGALEQLARSAREVKGEIVKARKAV
ncbi:MAG: FHA domain-containing protein [Deltaproteobacteria bacterium]|nr:FHA domain-containing protein [Deltaproteobacteria bacterium]